MSNVISGTAQLPRTSSQLTASQQGPVIQRVNIKGDPGTDGINAFSITLSVFEMPPADNTTPVSIAVENSLWAGMGQPVFIEGAGQLVVSDTGDPVLLTLVNPGTTGNASPGTSISLGKRASPSGVKGADGGGGGGGGATGYETVTFTAQGTYVVPAGAAVVVFAGTMDDGGTYLIQLTETATFAPIVLDFSFINVPTDCTLNLRIGSSGAEAPIEINQGTNPPIYYNLVYWDGNIGDAPIFMPIISGPPSFPSGGSTSTAPAINIGTDVYPGAGTIVISADDSAADYIQFTASAGLESSGVYTFELTFPSDTPVTFGSKILDFSPLLTHSPHNSTFRVKLGTAGLALTTLDNSKLFQANGGACIIGWDGAASNITFLPVIISSTPPTIDASVVTYTPAVSGNWSIPPTTTSAALDDLAAAVVGGASQELSPFDMTLHEIAHGNLPGFQGAISLDEEFTNSSLTRFTVYSEGADPNTPTISAGQMTFVNNSGQNTFMSEGTPLAIPQFAVKVTIASASSTSGNSYENPGVGYIRDQNNFMLATWERAASPAKAGIQVKISGTNNFRAEVNVSWTPPFDIGLSLVANTLTFWQKPNGGSWTKITSYVLTEIDMRATTLSAWSPTISLATDSIHTFTCSFAAFQAGLFGGVCIRDINPVVNLDGSPSLTGSVCDFTCTMCDPQGAAYCAVISYDLVSRALTHLSAIFVNRSGTIYNDNAAQILLDGHGGYHLFIASWGNNSSPVTNIFVQYKHETTLNLLSGQLAVASMTQLLLPNTGSAAAYDPTVYNDGSTWHVGYVISPSLGTSFYPALATTPDLSTWTLVGADSASVAYEGTRFVKMDGVYWLIAGSSLDSKVYDSTLTYAGTMSTLVEGSSRGVYPPHPTLVPYQNFVYQVTFDSTMPSGSAVGGFRVFRSIRYASG